MFSQITQGMQEIARFQLFWIFNISHLISVQDSHWEISVLSPELNEIGIETETAPFGAAMERSWREASAQWAAVVAASSWLNSFCN